MPVQLSPWQSFDIVIAIEINVRPLPEPGPSASNLRHGKGRMLSSGRCHCVP